MKTLERVARALVKPVVEWTGEELLAGLTWKDMADHTWPEFVPLARAALTALLEPSEEMTSRGSTDLWETAYLATDGRNPARSAFQAMIQQALKEGEEG